MQHLPPKRRVLVHIGITGESLRTPSAFLASAVAGQGDAQGKANACGPQLDVAGPGDVEGGVRATTRASSASDNRERVRDGPDGVGARCCGDGAAVGGKESPRSEREEDGVEAQDSGSRLEEGCDGGLCARPDGAHAAGGARGMEAGVGCVDEARDEASMRATGMLAGVRCESGVLDGVETMYEQVSLAKLAGSLEWLALLLERGGGRLKDMGGGQGCRGKVVVFAHHRRVVRALHACHVPRERERAGGREGGSVCVYVCVCVCVRECV